MSGVEARACASDSGSSHHAGIFSLCWSSSWGLIVRENKKDCLQNNEAIWRSWSCYSHPQPPWPNTTKHYQLSLGALEAPVETNILTLSCLAEDSLVPRLWIPVCTHRFPVSPQGLTDVFELVLLISLS